MVLRSLKKYITSVILILYVFVPVLDSMVCTDCVGRTPFQGDGAIGHLQTPHDDVVYTSHEETQAPTPLERSAKSFCSICANSLMGVEAFSPLAPIPVAPWNGPYPLRLHAQLPYAIDKPPQNRLV